MGRPPCDAYPRDRGVADPCEGIPEEWGVDLLIGSYPLISVVRSAYSMTAPRIEQATSMSIAPGISRIMYSMRNYVRGKARKICAHQRVHDAQVAGYPCTFSSMTTLATSIASGMAVLFYRQEGPAGS